VNITVILCTYNRCQSLQRTLESVAASVLPDSIEWEVLVVDNNSQDQTRTAVEEFSRRYPGRFRYLFEGKPGKSYALNAGIRAAQGDILAFTDDDVTVERAWLQNLTSPLKDGQWAGVGGRVILQWPDSIPRWLSKDGPYATQCFPGFDAGENAKELNWPPVGTNMAFRKSVVEKNGGFRTDLGPSPNREIPQCGEDTEFGRRLMSSGKRLRYEPLAVVFHPVPENLINKKFILTRRFDKGRAAARQFQIERGPLIFGLAARAARWLISVNPKVRFGRRLVVWEKAGTAAELRRRSQAAKRKRAKDVAAIRQDRANHLGLKAGEWVEVRTAEEILATLDKRGQLGNLPFMPEMLQYCGERFRVYKRADKTCDNIEPWSIRRMTNAVHLEGVRCDGEGHSGCEAGCLIFWKEAWLKRIKQDVVALESLQPTKKIQAAENRLFTVANLLDASTRVDENGESLYVCQATELLNFTSYMSAWDPRQYIRDLRSGNLASGIAQDSRSHRALETLLGVLEIVRAVTIGFFNTVQEKRHWRPTYPFIEGSAKKTPMEVLDLQPGELVEVRSKEEIMATLDKQNRNRGLLFDGAMLTYCGGIYKVLRRVYRMVDEKTGKMMEMKNPCIVLEGVICRGDYHRLCPKASYPYWREIWLKRTIEATAPPAAERIAQTRDNS
jgi:glycosyltransferase involved in cell wall biosynthesis